MKVITVLGSPRRNGNTASVLGLFESMIADDHEVDRIN
jgi:multimeric flavodoxin WrbA